MILLCYIYLSESFSVIHLEKRIEKLLATRWALFLSVCLVTEKIERKMAQTLAMPLAPSVSFICNKTNSLSLSNTVSLPVSNPPKVINFLLIFWIFFFCQFYCFTQCLVFLESKNKSKYFLQFCSYGCKFPIMMNRN